MTAERERLWAVHDREWRDPRQVTSQWEQAAAVDRRLLRFSMSNSLWDLLDSRRISLIVSREYEHLLMAFSVVGGRPLATFMPLPHPSGIAVDADQRCVFVASTRNPNQVYELRPVTGSLQRSDASPPHVVGRPLVPSRSSFHPGSLYLHDLALVGRRLHANAVGQNAVVRFGGSAVERVWWPRAIETPEGPDFSKNYLQLNSIAAGPSLAASFFSASATTMSTRRPGHRNFPVDRRGVIYSGRTREPIATGLTRPHSARLHGGNVWVDNSGYGEVGVARDGGFEPVARFTGWTRGLAFDGHVAFVGLSRVIPRFRQYAPGLDVDRSTCGVRAIDTRSGRVIGSLTWPEGNQVFAVECAPRTLATGFPFSVRGRRRTENERLLFYSYETQGNGGIG